jgi:hypothetical protein
MEPIEPIDLSVGDELDYNPAGGFWVMARVEQRPAPGGAAAAAAQAGPGAVSAANAASAPAAAAAAGAGHLVLRFAVGDRDVSHALDLRRPADARRVAPAGMRSVPLLDRQPVDVLRRAPATAGRGSYEQWQRGAFGPSGKDDSRRTNHLFSLLLAPLPSLLWL